MPIPFRQPQRLIGHMKLDHIPFDRRFVPRSEENATMDYSEVMGLGPRGLRWTDLMQHSCVVVLSEGRCGKTHEFEYQHQQRLKQNQFSFFIPLEQLYDSSVEDTLRLPELKAFEKWRKSPIEEATFFLDAVDELKVRSGTLRHAIRKLTTAINSTIHNAKFFISCRPGDWSDDGDAELDSDTVRMLLPAPANSVDSINQAHGEDLFLAAVCPTTHSSDTARVTATHEGADESKIHVVNLMPLTTAEIRAFAERYSPSHAAKFLEHIEVHDIWHLYRLPIDIIDGINLLRSKGQTGALANLKELLDWGVARRIRESSSKKRNRLPEDDTRVTAERTALALCLTKHRSFTDRSVHHKLPGELCLADVMTNWNQPLQEELLHKSLFTPTGVGRFRFHHRTTEEYLAANRLLALRQSGLSKSELYSLLFADVGNEQVVIPSMEPVAAWLAVLDADVFAEIKKRKPQLLLLQHFPTMLDTPRRAALITSFVDKYSGSQWRNLGLGWQYYERLATPELGPTLKELWPKAYTGHESRDLLLRLAASVKMPECADFAYQAAFDDTLPESQRIYAIWAVFKCGSAGLKEKLARDILAGNWPQSIVIRVLTSLYPESLTVDEFMSLVCSLDEHLIEPFGVHSAVLAVIQSEAVPYQETVSIRDRLASLIWEARSEPSNTNNSNYLHLTPALVGACCLTTPKTAGMDETEASTWARATVIGLSFGSGQIDFAFREGREKLKAISTSKPELRQACLFASVDLAEQMGANLNDEAGWIRSVDRNRAISTKINMEDTAWLLELLSAKTPYKYRLTAFNLLLNLLCPNETDILANAMLEAVGDCSVWQTEVARAMEPRPKTKHHYELETMFSWEEVSAKNRLAEQRTHWQAWRLDILDNPTRYLSGPTQVNTFAILLDAIQNHRHQSGHSRTWSDWDAAFIENSFSAEFLHILRIKLTEYWRGTDAMHWKSNFPITKFMAISGASVALMALKCNAETPGWENSLSPALAKLATRLVLEELDGRADILSAIESVHPEHVQSVFCSALKSGFKSIRAGQPAHVIGVIRRHGTLTIKRQASRLIAEWLPDDPKEIPISTSDSTVGNLFSLLKDYGSSEDRIAAIAVIRKYLYTTCLSGTNDRSYWLRTLCEFDFHQACMDLLQLTNDGAGYSDSGSGSKLFGAIFSSSRGDSDERFEQIEQTARLNLLGDLLVRSYTIQQQVKDGDQLLPAGCEHSSHLDLVRGTLLRSLSSVVSHGTLSLLYTLSNMTELSEIRGVLSQKVTDVAAALAEPNAMDVATFKVLESTKTYQAHDPVSLFNLMKNRLNDLEHDLSSSQFSVMQTIRRIPHETELRNFISHLMHHTSKGAYTVNQEAVVVGENRTDIRLQPGTMQQYATIELKLTGENNTWTAKQLADALTNQLVGKYLSNQQCQVGCLLICMQRGKYWRDPVTNKRMNLTQTVAWLQQIADGIMAKRHGLYLWVKGIDYSVQSV